MSDDHPITIAPADGRVIIRWRGKTIVDTKRALALREHVYPPVLYVPREDADMSLLARTASKTTCPYKGEANYFSLRDGAQEAPDAVWTYEHPKVGVAAIKDHLAFYPDRVEIERKPG
jgi:uncharacterized protein (DUF427 family)